MREGEASVLGNSLSARSYRILLVGTFPRGVHEGGLTAGAFLGACFTSDTDSQPRVDADSGLECCPQIFSGFLRIVTSPRPASINSFRKSRAVRKGVDRGLVFVTRRTTTERCLDRLRSRLGCLIGLSSSLSRGRAEVGTLLSTFRNLGAPFGLSRYIVRLGSGISVSGESVEFTVREVGGMNVFRSHPSCPNRLHINHLFGSSLGVGCIEKGDEWVRTGGLALGMWVLLHGGLQFCDMVILGRACM